MIMLHQLGGAEISTLTLRNLLRQKGHNVRLFASSARIFQQQPLADYSCFGTTSSFRTLLQTANISAWYRLRQVLKEFKPDCYAIAQRILQVMTQLLLGTINQVALSTFSRLQTDPTLLQKTFCQATQFTSLIAFPSFFGVIILAPELITVLFGKQWQPAIPIMQILTFAGLLRSISLFTESIFIAMNKPAWRLYLGVLNTIFNIVACVLAVRWGIVAIAIAYVLSDYLVFPFSQWAVSQLIQTPILTHFRQLIAPFVSALIMVVVILIVKYFLQNLLNSQVLLISCMVISTITYGLTIRLLAPKLWQQALELTILAISPVKIHNK